jgi:chemotaxis protein methyltransferase CheR
MVTSELRDIDFEKIRRLIYEKCGINLHEGKKELVSARLGKRLREGNFPSFAEYYRHVISDKGADELVQMMDSISTNLTYFFREDSHFHRLSAILPAMAKMAAARKVSPKLRIWSAACSTGEEPYSLAITVHECLNKALVDVKILATDISTSVLETAASGVYPEEKLKNVPSSALRKYFQRGTGKWEGYCRVKKELQDVVHFKRFNLMEAPPEGVYFDIIFCCNVMIYFDKSTQEALVNRIYQCLLNGGYLFVGHSESLTGLNHLFKYIEPSIYRKQDL